MNKQPKALDILREQLDSRAQETTPIRQLVNATKMTQRAFGEHLGIPLRTVENWVRGVNSCPDYVLDLIVYRLRNEGILP